MELVYIAMLLHKAGKEINEANIKRVVDAVGLKKSDAEIKGLVSALEGVNIDEVIKEAAIVQAPVAVKEEKKQVKEEAKEEKASEEKAAAGLGALFG